MFGVEALLPGTQAGVADIRSDDFQLPGRRDQRLWRRHFKRERIPQIVVSESVANQDGNGVGFLPGGTPRAPYPKIPVAAFLLLVKHLFKHGLLQQFELRGDSERSLFR